MAAKMVVVWRRPAYPTETLVPMDEEVFKDTAEEAVAAAKVLAGRLKLGEISPFAVLEIGEERIEALILGDKPMVSIVRADGGDADEEFVALAS